MASKPSFTPPENAVWLITGCSSGIGQALAVHLAVHTNCRVVATARKTGDLAPIPDGPNILKLSLDVTSQESVDQAVEDAVSKFGRLDVVVNNAGYALTGDTENATEEQERRVIETLFWGTVRLTKHAMRVMREANPKTGLQGGLVLQVTSLGGFVAAPGTAFYHAGKFAVEGFTESVSKEVRPEWNIHFCIIEPGGVQTNYAESYKPGIATRIKPHPAYEFPDTPSRVLDSYILNPEARKNWATAEDLAKSMVGVSHMGPLIPTRLPLGSDAWGMMKEELATIGKELDELKSLSTGVSSAEQLESIAFLRNQS